MWNDNDTTIDLIDFRHLVAAANSIISSKDLHPCTIGIYGDWGSGKSSLMKMIEAQLSGDPKVLCLKFNGWLFEGFDDAKTVLLSTLLDEIVKKRTLGDKAKKALSKLIKQVNWMKVAKAGLKHGAALATLGPAGLTLSTIGDAIGKFAQEDSSLLKEAKEEEPTTIRDFHENFSELLAETKIEKLIVLIDDLDRCLPDTIIETLEGIKLFLFVPNSVFIISADERLIKYAVRRRFPEIPGEGIEIGREYLEKLIQFPIRVPQLSTSEIETYITLLMAKLSIPSEDFEKVREKLITTVKNDHTQFSSREIVVEGLSTIPSDLDDSLVLANQITPILTRGLSGNPRQCKRFLNTLLLRITMASNRGIDLKRRILAKLMLLEYFKPMSFRELHVICHDNNGIIVDFKTLESIDVKPSPGKETTETVTEKIDDRFKVWRDDVWLQNWLKMEPQLGTVDLRPYFSFSRDQLDNYTGYLGKISPRAMEFLQSVLNPSEAIRVTVLKGASSLGESDAVAIFEALSQRINQTEGPLVDSIPFKAQQEFCAIRKDLQGQFITFWSHMTEDRVPLSMVPKLSTMSRDTAFVEATNTLLKKWSISTSNKNLATMATKQLEQK